MFRDAREELERLEKQLLETEEDAKKEYGVECEEETEYEDEDGIMPEDAPEYYRNYANDYRAYNTDRADVDLEQYSQDVRQPKDRKLGVLLAVAAVLMAAVACTLTYLILKMRGVL